MKSKTNIRLACLATAVGSLMTISAEADAAVRYVTPGGSGDGSSWAEATDDLQAAIDASSPGDEVWVAAGTYQPFNLINEKVATSYAFILKNGVSLYGGFAGTETSRDQRQTKPDGKAWDMANPTILSGDDDFPDNWERVIAPGTSFRYTWNLSDRNEIPGTEKNCTHVIYAGDVITDHTVIDGFTITGGCANQYKVKAMGGGIFAQGDVSISACRFVENVAYFRNETINPINALGGAVYLNGAGKASVSDCYFLRSFSNSSYTQGMGGALFVQNADVARCVFDDCVAEDGGGAVLQFGGSLRDCTFNNCYGSAGGALYTTGTVENVEVYNCRGLLGGGIYAAEGAVVTHAKVYDCYADAVEFGEYMGGRGGGIMVEGGSVIGCVVYNNTAFRGAGICVREGQAEDRTPLKSMVVSCTVQHNTGRDGYTPTSNIAVWDPANDNGDDIDPTTTEYFFNTIGNPDADDSNFRSPSLFKGRASTDDEREALAAADWSLAQGSEFIDAGTSTPGVTETTDMAGNPRVVGAAIDRGAYEYLDNSGIDNIATVDPSDITATEYYSLTGVRLGNDKPAPGYYIAIHSLNDGRRVAQKVIIR